VEPAPGWPSVNIVTNPQVGLIGAAVVAMRQ
jgi:hypothetical protein